MEYERDHAMRAPAPAAAFAAVIALLGGCTANPGPETAKQEGPELVWDGYLSEVDGEAIRPSGVLLAIYRDPDSQDGRLRYEVTNGCTASGSVSKDGEVLPYENLRACMAEAIPLIGRIHVIAPGGLPAPDEPARLTWNPETAHLSSVRGEARFKSDR